MMVNIRPVRVLQVIVVIFLFVFECQGQGYRRSSQRSRSLGNRRTGGLPSNLQHAYRQAVSDTTLAMQNWATNIPTIPQAHEVECYVEVTTVTSQGGRCTQLGGELPNRPYICQSGRYFEFSDDCQRQIRNRSPRQQDHNTDVTDGRH